MLDNEELLFNELYEKTKDCGRTQFIKLLMQKDRENQELKLELSGYRQAILNNKEMLGLKEKNQELKKQLEEYIKQNMKLKDELFDKRKEYQDTYKDVRIEIKEYKTQQKEFIKWLEDEIKLYENDIQNFKKDYKVYFSLINDLRVSKAKIEEILQKYKEIIGDYK